MVTTAPKIPTRLFLVEAQYDFTWHTTSSNSFVQIFHSPLLAARELPHLKSGSRTVALVNKGWLEKVESVASLARNFSA